VLATIKDAKEPLRNTERRCGKMSCPYSHITPSLCLNCHLPLKMCDGGNHQSQTPEESYCLAIAGIGYKSCSKRRPPVIPPRVCPVCGKQFVPRSTRQVYCSKHCQYTARRKRDKESAAAGVASFAAAQTK
jgi:predicted nucleic acid-binding Zn ribbon protein